MLFDEVIDLETAGQPVTFNILGDKLGEFEFTFFDDINMLDRVLFFEYGLPTMKSFLPEVRQELVQKSFTP